ncbi:hypothetical protein KKB41_04240 [Patescibacteria group bacterium]|nr:hypothetical protein [Patescibacteria group bacterium]
METNKKNYITLKEAGELSGYAPDYIGQLIRKGKLHGKQVYCNIAWMTTKEAIGRYMQENKDTKKNPPVKKTTFGKIKKIKHVFLEKLKVVGLFKFVMYAVIVICLVFFMLLFYIFSIRFENKMQEEAILKAQKENSANSSLIIEGVEEGE